jgi:hypothetical protein
MGRGKQEGRWVEMAALISGLYGYGVWVYMPEILLIFRHGWWFFMWFLGIFLSIEAYDSYVTYIDYIQYLEWKIK